MTTADLKLSVRFSSIPIRPSQSALSGNGHLQDETAAAEVVFFGRVQPFSIDRNDRRVIGIDYDIPEDEFKLKVIEIIEEVKKAIPELKSVDVLHRTGFVAVGDYTSVTTICSRHRTSAAHALDIIVGRMKSEAPFVKKEIFECK